MPPTNILPSNGGWLSIHGITYTIRRPTPHGSTRWRSGSISSRSRRSAEAPSAVSKNSNRRSSNTSTPTTVTPGPSSGLQRPIQYWPRSTDFVKESLGRNTSTVSRVRSLSPYRGSSFLKAFSSEIRISTNGIVSRSETASVRCYNVSVIPPFVYVLQAPPPYINAVSSSSFYGQSEDQARVHNAKA
jgi:hypothetical protein